MTFKTSKYKFKIQMSNYFIKHRTLIILNLFIILILIIILFIILIIILFIILIIILFIILILIRIHLDHRSHLHSLVFHSIFFSPPFFQSLFQNYFSQNFLPFLITFVFQWLHASRFFRYHSSILGITAYLGSLIPVHVVLFPAFFCFFFRSPLLSHSNVRWKLRKIFFPFVNKLFEDSKYSQTIFIFA